MFPHPFFGCRHSEFPCTDETSPDPVTALTAMVCIIGLPFWLIYDFVKQIVQKFVLSTGKSSQKISKIAES